MTSTHEEWEPSEPSERSESDADGTVMRCESLQPGGLEELFLAYGLVVRWVAAGEAIPGSYWGAPEAGLLGDELWLRPDTPVHSALHEGCHWICMDESRRRALDTDAGGDDLEESAVCVLQILLADRLHGVGAERLMTDMDAWGYSFRLGSTRQWLEHDADDARRWLVERELWPGAALSGSEAGRE